MSNKALTISIEQADRLFWLGRYLERVYTTLKLFNTALDTMIDQDELQYVDFCRRLSIPSDIYANATEFEHNYLFDAENPDSVYSNLSRAYDNAIVLRNFISTETLSFVQMALDMLQKGGDNRSAFLETQQVIDWILAFWGSIEENVLDPERRDLMKVGKYVERIDLALRLDMPYEIIERMVPRLANRSDRVRYLLNAGSINQFRQLVKTEAECKANAEAALDMINSLHY